MKEEYEDTLEKEIGICPKELMSKNGEFSKREAHDDLGYGGSMKTILLVNNENQLNQVNDIIHDLVFDKNRISFDEHAKSLSIPFDFESSDDMSVEWKIWIFKKVTVPICKYVLKILFTNSYELIKCGVEGPGSDELFNYIEYDMSENVVNIAIQYDKAIKVSVSNLQISIEDSGEIIGFKKRLLPFWF